MHTGTFDQIHFNALFILPQQCNGKGLNFSHSRSQQRTDQRVLVLTLVFPSKKYFQKYGPAAQTSPELIFHVMNMSQDLFVSLSVMHIRPNAYARHSQHVNMQ